MPVDSLSARGEDPPLPDPLPDPVALGDASSPAASPLADALPDPVAADARPSLATLPPWDSSQPWPEPDPNQVGSGWDDADVFAVPDWSHSEGPGSSWDGEVSSPGGTAHASHGVSQPAAAPASPNDSELAATYDQVVFDIVRLLLDGNGQWQPSDYVSPWDPSPLDDDPGNEIAWFQDYLEFVLLQRACATTRSQQGLPAVACTRHSPCDTCRRHDGSYVPSTFWHSMSDEDLERHLAQYHRVRDRLPPWRSRRPPNVAPPYYYYGDTDSTTAPSPSMPQTVTAPPVASLLPSTTSPRAAAPALASPTFGTPPPATPSSSGPATSTSVAALVTSWPETGDFAPRRRRMTEDELAEFQRHSADFSRWVDQWSASLSQDRTEPAQTLWGRQSNGAMRAASSRRAPSDGNLLRRTASPGDTRGGIDAEEGDYSSDGSVSPLLMSDGSEAPRHFPNDWMSHPVDCACRRWMRARR